MYNALVNLHSRVDALVPPHEVTSGKLVEFGKDKTPEVTDLMGHLLGMKELRVKRDTIGVLRVETTEIRVESGYGGSTFLISRYGKIKVPVKVVQV